MPEPNVIAYDCRPLFWEELEHRGAPGENSEDFLVFEESVEKPESINLRTDGDEAERISNDAITVNDICETYRVSEPLSLLPMERWAVMVVEDECFPLLAKRFMQDAKLVVERRRSSSLRRTLASSFENDGCKAILVGIDGDITTHCTVGRPARKVQCGPSPPDGSHDLSRARSSKSSGMVAKSSISGRQNRRALHKSPLLAVPDHRF